MSGGRGREQAESDRRRKLEALRELGIDVRPSRFDATHSLKKVGDDFGDRDGEALEAIPDAERSVQVAGRIVLLRSFGKAAFLMLGDHEARLQVHVRKDVLSERDFAASKLLDLGDWIGVSGPVFRTRTGELTVRADSLTFLAKALLPMPEKRHGLADRDLRYRKRYLDLIGNPETAAVFRKRAALVRSFRDTLDRAGFLEVETPMLQALATGAAARPFRTHHNALNMDLFLRVAPELYLKRLVVGGFPKVYEINRNFRNEGLSTRHNPEFTMLEAYQAFADCEATMDLTEDLLVCAADEMLGGEPARFGDHEIHFRGWFRRLEIQEATSEVLARHPDVFGTFSPDDLRDRRTLVGICQEVVNETSDVMDTFTASDLLMYLFERFVEPELIEPTFITGYPLEASPLAKARPDDPETADRFELFAGGLEIANGFSELNDPDEQKARFGEQLDRRQRGEAHAMDEDYIEALLHGLPPTGGVGIGVDRVAMLFTNSPAIRDVILFPHLRPRGGDEPDGED